MRNPFIYGKIVAGEDFCDREKERTELYRDLKSGERVFLISPRRYGKSSLMLEVEEKLKKAGFLVAHIDLFKVSSLSQFLETYSQELSKAAETTLTGASKFIKEFLLGIRPKITIGPDGKPRVEIGLDLSKKELLTNLSEVYDLPQKIAKKRRKRFVVVFDEFQEIAELGGEKIEKAMRAAIQRQPLVSYLFAGSKKHLMYNLVADKNRAFYKMARIMRLEKLPPEIFAAYLENKFRKTGFRLEEGLIGEVINQADGYPYNTQFLCHKLWDLRLDSKKVAKQDIEEAIKEILLDQNLAYIALWETLSNHQKKLLIAITKYGGESVQSSEFIKKGDLSAASSVQTSKGILQERDIIDKENSGFIITDPFFKEWILKQIIR